MQVKRVFNNNVVLGLDDAGRDVVILGCGVGFGAHPNDVIDKERIERTFVPHDTSVERLASFVADIPLSIIEAIENVLPYAREQLGEHITERVLIPLADHVNFAVMRARENAHIEYPLVWEVENLYPAEVRVARYVHQYIEKTIDVSLSPQEIVPLALHFVNAQYGSGDMESVMRMTKALAASFEIIEQDHGISLDEESAAVARFITHMRFLFFRQQTHASTLPIGDGITAAVQEAQPREYATARRVAARLGELFQWNVTDEEVLYLALHVTRLTAPLRSNAPTAESR